MKVEVRYLTDFGSQRQTMTLNKLTRFIHKHHVIALYEVKKVPEVANWDELPVVDSEDGNGVSIRRNFLKENYPNGIIIKTK
jgi:hypothetical protein